MADFSEKFSAYYDGVKFTWEWSQVDLCDLTPMRGSIGVTTSIPKMAEVINKYLCIEGLSLNLALSELMCYRHISIEDEY